MKVNTLITFALAGAAQASVVRRDEELPAAKLLEEVFQSMTNADNHLLNFENDPKGLHEAGFGLLETLKCGAKIAAAMPALSCEDVAGIGELSYQVSSIGAKFLGDLEASVPAFEACGVCEYAYDFSLKLAEASNKLFEANKDKFPADSAAMAAEEIASKNAMFAEVQAALAPGACVNKVEPGEGGVPSLPDQKPSATTSIAYHTGNGLPGVPTSEPSGHPGGNHTAPGGGHHGPHSGQPPKPVLGSALILGSSWSLLVLPAAVSFFML